jgi:hypothetical protein
MKTIDTRSLFLGAVATLLIMALSGSRPADDADPITFIASPAGAGIYNKQTKTLYMYSMMMGNLKTRPNAIYKVSEDGSGLTEIK